MVSRPPRFRPGLLVRIRGDVWRIRRVCPCGDAILVDVAGASPPNAGTTARFLAPFEAIHPLRSTTALRVVRPHRWRRAARRLIAHSAPVPGTLRAAAEARIDILPYQFEPALAFLGGHASRLLVADEVGLGKTIQAGLVIAELLARDPAARALVVCPAGLRAQWHEELLTRFALDAMVADAAGLAAAGATLDPTVSPWEAGRVAITSIDYLKRTEVIGGIDSLIWDLVVFDEAHHLAGDTARAAAAAALGVRARRVLLLTATPHSGDEGTFERLCGLGRLPGDAPLLVFRRRKADVSLPAGRRDTLLRVRPSPAERAMHAALAGYARAGWKRTAAGSAARLVLSFLMRRACSSAAALRRSVERRLTLLGREDTTAQFTLPLFDADDAEQFDALLSLPLLDDTNAERRTLERLAALAGEASLDESKPAALARLLRRSGEPVLLFTEYRDTLEHVATRLGGSRTRLLHGDMTVAERARAARDFTAGSARLLIATDAAGEGLNLQARCRLVVNLELPWTAQRLEQRVGRVDRLGQTRTVHGVHMVARGTYEERVLARLITRRTTARDTLDALTGAAARPDVAARAPGGPTSEQPPTSQARGGVSPALRAAAEQGATWIRRARTLDAADRGLETRPVATVLSARRQPGRRRSALAVWRLTIVGADGRPLWDTLAGLTMPAAVTRRTPAALRRAASLVPRGAVRAAIRAAYRAALAGAREELLRTGALQLVREDAIAGLLRQERRRLSTTMAQAGLFDRRVQRSSAAIDERLQQALERCRERRLALVASLHPRAGRLSLVMAVVWR